MEKKLDFFYIGDSYGGNQDWCLDHMMQLGGCAAITACDSALYFALHHGKTSLYKGDLEKPEQDEYLYFTEEMKEYLHPRWCGIDKPEIYVEGFTRFLEDKGEKVTMTILPGTADEGETEEWIMEQIEKDLPVPILILNHENPAMEDYVWHWFLLIGYRYDGDNALAEEGRFQVQTLTYSEAKWVDFRSLWNTGREAKGGIILYSL